MLSNVVLYNVMLYYVTLCYVMLHKVISYYVILCYVVLCVILLSTGSCTSHASHWSHAAYNNVAVTFPPVDNQPWSTVASTAHTSRLSFG